MHSLPARVERCTELFHRWSIAGARCQPLDDIPSDDAPDSSIWFPKCRHPAQFDPSNHFRGDFSSCQLFAHRPEMTHRFASAHDAQLWGCLCQLLDITTTRYDVGYGNSALCNGGMGLRSAVCTRSPAYWACWGDCLSMMRARHPEVVTHLLAHLQNPGHSPCLDAAVEASRNLIGVSGFVPPSWEGLANGFRPPPRQVEDFEPGTQRAGWQHEVASRVERSMTRICLGG